MVNELLIPLDFSSRRIKSHEAIAVKKIAGVSAAKIIVGAIALHLLDRDEDGATLFVNCEHPPQTGTGLRIGAAIEPRRTIWITLLRLQIERPPWLARNDVKRLHVFSLAGLSVSFNDEKVFVDHSGRVRSDISENAAVRECRDERPRLRINCRQARGGAGIDPGWYTRSPRPVSGAANGRASGVFASTSAAATSTSRGCHSVRSRWLSAASSARRVTGWCCRRRGCVARRCIFPDLLARCCIDRVDAVRGAEVHHAINYHRRTGEPS